MKGLKVVQFNLNSVSMTNVASALFKIPLNVFVQIFSGKLTIYSIFDLFQIEKMRRSKKWIMSKNPNISSKDNKKKKVAVKHHIFIMM